jgi:hypothetical protein
MVGVQGNFLQEFHEIADSAREQILYALLHYRLMW